MPEPDADTLQQFLRDYFARREGLGADLGIARSRFIENVAERFHEEDSVRIERWLGAWSDDGLILLRKEPGGEPGRLREPARPDEQTEREYAPESAAPAEELDEVVLPGPELDLATS